MIQLLYQLMKFNGNTRFHIDLCRLSTKRKKALNKRLYSMDSAVLSILSHTVTRATIISRKDSYISLNVIDTVTYLRPAEP